MIFFETEQLYVLSKCLNELVNVPVYRYMYMHMYVNISSFPYVVYVHHT